MTHHREEQIGLIMLGAGRRVLIAAIMVAVLWILFYWATATPGAL